MQEARIWPLIFGQLINVFQIFEILIFPTVQLTDGWSGSTLSIEVNGRQGDPHVAGGFGGEVGEGGDRGAGVHHERNDGARTACCVGGGDRHRISPGRGKSTRDHAGGRVDAQAGRQVAGRVAGRAAGGVDGHTVVAALNK